MRKRKRSDTITIDYNDGRVTEIAKRAGLYTGSPVDPGLVDYILLCDRAWTERSRALR